MSPRLRRVVTLVTFASLASAATPIARAAPSTKPGGGAKAVCLAAHEEALALRGQKKPHAAHEKFVACARVECPTVVRRECGEQLSLVEKDAPTVVLEARDESGADTTAVKVSMDGSPLVPRLTGGAVDVEPGEHLFRFERASGAPIEQRVLIVEGDKNRKVVAEFASLVAKAPGDALPPPPSARAPTRVPVAAYVAGGIAVLGLGSFGFFALSGKSAEKDLASGCSPSCSDAELSPVKRDYLIADVSLGIGVVAVVAAVLLALPALSDSPPSSSRAASSSSPAPWLPRITIRAQR